MSDIKGLREISNDPFGKLLTALSKKFSAFLAKDQAELVENPEDIYSDGQDVESALKFHNFAISKQFPIIPTNVQYYSATEPDHDKVTLMLGPVWLNLGTELTDMSGYDNNALIQGGEPTLVDGEFDLGVVDSLPDNTKSIAMRFNRPSSEFENEEYLSVADCVDLFVSGITIGNSYFIRFKIYDLGDQDDHGRTLFEKIDDSTPNNGIRVLVDIDGRLVVRILRAGTQYNSQTATLTIATDTVYDVFITYTVSGNVTHVYVNNADKSLTDPGTSTNWHTPLTNHDLSIFHRGGTEDGGHVYGDFYAMTLWHEKVVSATDVGRHFTNKLTLANIPFGQVAITNYSASFGTALIRVSKSMTYKWNVVGVTRISKSMTLKYNIKKRISLSRIYKWNITITITPSATSFTGTSFTSTSFTT